MRTIWGKEVFDTLGELVDPEHTALILIDLQNDLCHPDGYYGKFGKDLSQFHALIPRVGRLIDGARVAGVLVVWIQTTFLPDALADSPSWLRRRTKGWGAPEWTIEGTWGQEFVQPLFPRSREPVVKKHRSSAFVSTNLDLILRSNEIRSLVITGVVTQGCVESTARDATFYDYYVVFVRDCVGTTSAELHAASLACQASRYDFAESPEILDVWQHGRARALATANVTPNARP